MSVQDPVQFAEDLQLPTTRTDNALIEVQATIDAALASVGTVYAILLSQTGTSAPSATVVQNGLSGAAPTFSRAATGVYTINKTGGFPLGKTIVLPGNLGATSPGSTTAFDIIIAYQVNADQIAVTTRTVTSGTIAMADDVLVDTCLYVVVFP